MFLSAFCRELDAVEEIKAFPSLAGVLRGLDPTLDFGPGAQYSDLTSAGPVAPATRLRSFAIRAGGEFTS